MKFFAALFTYCALMINVGQEAKPTMILKAYVSLQIVIRLDDMYSSQLPKSFQSNAKQVKLKIGEDHNTFKKIWNRLKYTEESFAKGLIIFLN